MINKFKALLLTGLFSINTSTPIQIFNPNEIYRVNTLIPKKQEVKQEVFLYVDGYGKMELEEIVYNGLIAEMGYPSFNIEAYKAQAVAIRTFALSNKKHDGELFDLCGTTCCFVVADEKKKSKFTQEQLNRFKRAVEETKGEILTYNDKIISTPIFFAYGHNSTNTPNDVWNSDNNRYPYLQSVETPEKIEPQIIEYTKDEFCKLLNIDSFEAFKILRKNDNGYNKDIEIQTLPMYDYFYYNGNQLRSTLKLKSGNFNIYNEGDKIKIVCYGYGHGVGMSQYGANEYANQGWNYKDILKHYYQGTNVSTI